MKRRMVLLPHNKWIVYHPQKQVYNVSARGDEYAVIQFDNQLCLVYLFSLYRKELKRSDPGKALALSPPVLKPKTQG